MQQFAPPKVLNTSSERTQVGTSDGEPIATLAIVQNTTFSHRLNGTLDSATNNTTNVSGLVSAYEGKDCLSKRAIGPSPVILMTQGRSGSHSTWQILGNLTGLETRADEYTGSDTAESKEFFEQTIGDEYPNWIVDRMCYKQWKFMDWKPRPGAATGIVGFNWKPHVVDMERPIVREGLQVVADLAKSGNPLEIIRVIRSVRNPLDLYLSRLKHKTSSLRAHCYTEMCVEQHMRASQGLEVDPKQLVKSVKGIIRQERVASDLLLKLEVPTIFVSYDSLYYPDTPESGSAEWNRILAFLGKRANFTWEEITSAMALTPTTTSRSHRDRFSNFTGVQEAFTAAGLQYLLRP